MPSAPVHPAPAPPGPGLGAELWLVRHAEVAAEWQGRAYGDLDVPLSPEGRAESESMAAALAEAAPSGLLTSPLRRARELAEALGRTAGLEPRDCAALREVHRGTWQGRAVEELFERESAAVEAFYDDPWSWCGHGGECDADLAARAWPPLRAALEGLGDGRLVVTTHYNVIRVLVASALGIPPAHSFSLRVDPARLTVLRDHAEGWQLLHANLRRPPAERTPERLF